MRALTHVLLLIPLCWFGGNSLAGIAAIQQDESLLLQQRAIFVAAEEALRNRETTTYQQLRNKLLDYPLLPYLDYQETLETLEQQSIESVTNRLKWLEGTPLAKKLRSHWLALLAKEKLWVSYLQFSYQGGAVGQQCNPLQAMIETGKAHEAFNSVEPIWLSGRSQPKACDPVFKAWIATGNLTTSLVWQRINLAMSVGRTRLARYLKRYLPPAEKSMVDRWLKIYRHPEQVVTLLKNTHAMRDEMVTQAIRRLAWRDLDAAYIAWKKFHNQAIFSDYQQRKIVYALASRLAREPNKQINQQLISLLPSHLQLDSTLSEKLLQAALQENDWQWVLQTIDTLSPKERQQEQWRYWHSRALIELGRKQEGKTLLQSLATERSYYGFLAAQRLGDEPNLDHMALQADRQLVETLAKRPGLIRARELIRLDRPFLARQEWNLALKDANQDELKAAARLAQHWEWPSQTILTLARLRHWNDLELRFPLAHRQAIADQARDHGIDTAWIYAILRQESAFISDARSTAGARGLMQLMPKTAKQVAKELKQSPVRLEDLYQPEVNIKLGAGYLNKVYRQLQESPVLATAAYNAGPHRVLSWLPEQSQASDIWIETVPFKETREYLKRVFAYTVIYSYRLGNLPKTLPLEWLRPIKAPKTEADRGRSASDV
ncbi:MAG: transglycosylase SLT domain-containing protein [Candidatus Thiodiazotropha endolucinida]|uniref:Soluble lytic murein transglycosylase n=1 Tax=Candidatus Thiodiazotropha endolucinida TaxID=1655433 RepID=A0A7Z1AH33_9GAMM|nr:transglycosylase SLT domain-containing protein [Candidatus Thiodiazotropha endolucinida]ODJ89592.1 soluble lytic murein transglycosylase precursor [Candidatus Thiodiazotropha endolucinida]